MGTADGAKRGQTIIIVGLSLQIIFFGFFLIVAITFHSRFVHNEPRKAQLDRNFWHRQLSALYVGSVLILVRSIFRVIEYVMGNDGLLLKHEYYLYIFDAAMMFLVMVLFILVHPSRLAAARRRSGHNALESSENELVDPKRSLVSSGEI